MLLVDQKGLLLRQSQLKSYPAMDSGHVHTHTWCWFSQIAPVREPHPPAVFSLRSYKSCHHMLSYPMLIVQELAASLCSLRSFMNSVKVGFSSFSSYEVLNPKNLSQKMPTALLWYYYSATKSFWVWVQFRVNSYTALNLFRRWSQYSTFLNLM